MSCLSNDTCFPSNDSNKLWAPRSAWVVVKTDTPNNEWTGNKKAALGDPRETVQSMTVRPLYDQMGTREELKKRSNEELPNIQELQDYLGSGKIASRAGTTIDFPETNSHDHFTHMQLPLAPDFDSLVNMEYTSVTPMSNDHPHADYLARKSKECKTIPTLYSLRSKSMQEQYLNDLNAASALQGNDKPSGQFICTRRSGVALSGKGVWSAYEKPSELSGNADQEFRAGLHLGPVFLSRADLSEEVQRTQKVCGVRATSAMTAGFAGSRKLPGYPTSGEDRLIYKLEWYEKFGIDDDLHTDWTDLGDKEDKDDWIEVGEGALAQ